MTAIDTEPAQAGRIRVRAPGTGNIATGDLVCTLHEMGHETGIEPAGGHRGQSRRPADADHPPAPGAHTLVAGPVERGPHA